MNITIFPRKRLIFGLERKLTDKEIKSLAHELRETYPDLEFEAKDVGGSVVDNAIRCEGLNLTSDYINYLYESIAKSGYFVESHQVIWGESAN